MKTSDAIRNNFKCPVCKDDLCQDHKGKGYVRHKKVNGCKNGRGEKD